MPGSDALRVELVGPRVWRPLVEQAFASLERRRPHYVRLAETILWTCHNRHVGITPWLVRQLVPALIEPRQSAVRSAEPGWGNVLQRLVQEITPPRRDGVSAARFHDGIALGASPTYAVQRVLVPLVQRACQDIGGTCLFAADDAGTTVTLEQYTKYMHELAAAILALANVSPETDDTTGEVVRDPFWYEPAAGLSSLVRADTGAGGRSWALPVADPIDLALLLRLRPRIVESDWARRRKLSMPVTRVQGRRRREDGYVGIYLTHRDEDLPSMLLSEWLLPPPLLADRLLNTGFLALERRPRRQRIRDVLIVGIMPPELNGRAGADFARACWVDCQLRLSTLLRQHRLLNSEIRWIEGDSFDRQRVCAFHLDDLPSGTEGMNPFTLNQARREGLLSAMRWLPTYVDERAHFSGETSVSRPAPAVNGAGQNGTSQNGDSQDDDPDEFEPPPRSILPDWLFAAWRSQQARASRTDLATQQRRRRHQPAASRQDGNARPERRESAPVDSFAFVHVMLFLPAELRPAGAPGEGSAGAVLGSLRGRLGLGGRADRHVSITWVPDTLATPSAWAVDTRRRAGETLVDDSSDEPDDDELAGRLVTTWLREITEELSGG